MSDNNALSSAFHGKLNEYIIESPGRMYIFEITKLCGYSTFIFMYKDEMLIDLFTRVSHHFGCKDIQGLYIDSSLNKNNNNDDSNKNDKPHNHNCNHVKVEKLIPILVSSRTTIREFIFNNTAKEPRNMEPIYGLPYPVVYRIYFDDGHCHCGF